MPETREIPAGKILLAEYGTFGDDERAQVTKLDEVTSSKGKTYRIIHSTPGFESAGSVARWTNGYYAVRFDNPNGSIGGRQFKTEAEARAMLALWMRPDYTCPNCGSEEVPATAVRCAERITYYNCTVCDFSTWDVAEYQQHRN